MSGLDPETKAAKWDSATIKLIIYICDKMSSRKKAEQRCRKHDDKVLTSMKNCRSAALASNSAPFYFISDYHIYKEAIFFFFTTFDCICL